MSQHLAQFFGLYLAIVGLAFLFRPRSIKTAGWQLTSQPAVLLLSSIVTLLLGIALVLLHNLWVADWRIILTLIAWLTLIKGIFLLYFPQKAELIMGVLQNKTTMVLVGLVAISIALILLCHGFWF